MAAVWIRYRGVRMPIRRRTVLGRSPYSTLVVDGSAISRQHAILDPDSEGLIVSDAGSRNGTRVNGSLIQGPQRVWHGDVVQIGHERIVVEFGDHESDVWETPSIADFVELVAGLPGRRSDRESDSHGSIPTIEIATPALPPLSTLHSSEDLSPDSEPEPDSGHEPRQ